MYYIYNFIIELPQTINNIINIYHTRKFSPLFKCLFKLNVIFQLQHLLIDFNLKIELLNLQFFGFNLTINRILCIALYFSFRSTR